MKIPGFSCLQTTDDGEVKISIACCNRKYLIKISDPDQIDQFLELVKKLDEKKTQITDL
jgi:hypothetical protein